MRGALPAPPRVEVRSAEDRLRRDDAAVLLIDHQGGLISLVQDFSPGEFKNNVLALAAVARFFELPTIPPPTAT